MESLQGLSERKVNSMVSTYYLQTTIKRFEVLDTIYTFALQKRLLLHEEAVRTNERVGEILAPIPE